MSGKYLSVRLLFVVNDASFLISHRWPLLMEAQNQGWDIQVASAQSTSLEWIGSQGIKIHTIPFERKGINFFRELRCIFSICLLYLRLKPTLVHHITAKPIIYGGLAARILGIRGVINAVTGLGEVFTLTGFLGRFYKGALRYALKISMSSERSRNICQNPDDVKELWGQNPPSYVELIRGAGVDPQEYYAVPEPDPKNIPIVVLASRMLWTKGVGEFVSAAQRSKELNNRCRFVLVGDTDHGNPKAIPIDTLKEWDSKGIIEWWGRREHMHCVFKQATLVVLPTVYREGVPKVLIEAASVGRALVATDMPGCREIVRHKYNGLVVPPGDVDALLMAIVQLVEDDRERKQMGARGRQMVIQDFSLDKVVKKTFKVYKSLL